MMGGAVQGNQPRPEANSTAGTTGTERTTEHGSGAPGGAGGFSNIFQL